MIKKALVALAVSGAMATAQAGVLVKEGFDNVTTLAGSGWVLNNASNPTGTTTWAQGDQTILTAKNGAPESFISANYNNAAAGGALDNWLITPEFSTEFGALVSFWLRGAADDGFSDQIAYGFSNGSTSLTSFVLESAFTVPTGEWTRYVARIGAAEGTARFAIQYTGAADLANYIGIDSLSVSEVPEPSTMLILAAGVMGLTAARRRKRA